MGAKMARKQSTSRWSRRSFTVSKGVIESEEPEDNRERTEVSSLDDQVQFAATRHRGTKRI
jgi:hypothetical protein